MAKVEKAQVEETVVDAKVKPKFKVTKNVTMKLFRLVEDEPLYVQIDGAMFVGKEIKAGAGEAKKQPAILCEATNLETGEKGQFIVSAVVKENLKECYPDDGYIGKQFEIIKHAKRAGKSYNDYSVTEIEIEE